MIPTLRPTDQVTDHDREHGLRMLLYDGICSQAMGVLTGGAFLVAMALLLGASNLVIGLLAAVGPLTQIMQIPAIFLVERIRRRKALVVVSSFFSRLFLVVIAGLPFLVPEAARVPILVGALFAYFALGAVSGCAFNSWMRDFVPEGIMGRYFARRLAVATALGAGLSLAAGIGVDLWDQVSNRPLAVYSILFVVGGGSGLVGVFFLARIPEPRMAETHSHGLFHLLSEPLREPNFRRLLAFLGTWSFAVNLAGPFFTVYMLSRLGLSMRWVISLAVASQVTNVLFLQIWGRLADRFTNKSVLSVSGPLFIVSIAAWPFTTMPDRWVLTVPLLIAIHALAGMSTAGVALASSNIALKAAPRGKATAYLATSSLVNGAAATLAPILGGLAADGFAGRRLSLLLNWTPNVDGGEVATLPAFDLQGLDFLFVISFIFGLYAIHRLLALREEGEVEEKVVVAELYAETRKALKSLSNVAGLRHLTYFPYAKLRDLLAR